MWLLQLICHLRVLHHQFALITFFLYEYTGRCEIMGTTNNSIEVGTILVAVNCCSGLQS